MRRELKSVFVVLGARRAVALDARSDTEALQRATSAARRCGWSSHQCIHCCSTRVFVRQQSRLTGLRSHGAAASVNVRPTLACYMSCTSHIAHRTSHIAQFAITTSRVHPPLVGRSRRSYPLRCFDEETSNETDTSHISHRTSHIAHLTSHISHRGVNPFPILPARLRFSRTR